METAAAMELRGVRVGRDPLVRISGIEKQKLSFVSVVAGFIVVAVALQLAGFQRTRGRSSGNLPKN